MKFAPMINSLLENDAYKFSMGQVYFMKQRPIKNKEKKDDIVTEP